jgi:hypothetical protein
MGLRPHKRPSRAHQSRRNPWISAPLRHRINRSSAGPTASAAGGGGEEQRQASRYRSALASHRNRAAQEASAPTGKIVATTHLSPAARMAARLIREASSA